MSANTAEDLYELVRHLPTAELLRLVERIAHDLSVAVPAAEASRSPPQAFAWAQLAGSAPRLLGGQDAQAWVSASRREDDEAREPSRGRSA
jgi:hypothetical protein